MLFKSRDSLPDLVTKLFRLPVPLLTRVLRLVVADGDENIDVKIDVFGESAKKTYSKDRVFRPGIITEGEYFFEYYCVIMCHTYTP